MTQTKNTCLQLFLILVGLCAAGCGAVEPESRAGSPTRHQLAAITDARQLPRDKAVPGKTALHKVIFHKGIRYYSGVNEHEEKHLLDLYLPEGKEDWPLLHFVHGGGWFWGHKNQKLPFYGAYKILGRGFASRGIGVAISNYRLSPEFKHPAHVHDVAAAWVWLCDNIEDYGGDPGQMYLMGQSAGGHLVSLLATGHDFSGHQKDYASRIRAVISMSGIYDLASMSPRPDKTIRLVKQAFGTDPDLLKEASPLYHASDRIPPFVLLTAERDPGSLRKQAESFARKLEENSVDFDFLIIPEKNHFNSIGDIGRANDAATAYITEYILNFGKTAAEK